MKKLNYGYIKDHFIQNINISNKYLVVYFPVLSCEHHFFFFFLNRNKIKTIKLFCFYSQRNRTEQFQQQLVSSSPASVSSLTVLTCKYFNVVSFFYITLCCKVPQGLSFSYVYMWHLYEFDFEIAQNQSVIKPDVLNGIKIFGIFEALRWNPFQNW